MLFVPGLRTAIRQLGSLILIAADASPPAPPPRSRSRQE